MATDNIVSTKQKDYLETDDPIRNQNYCCLSFISPEDVLVNKESFMFYKFLEKFSTDMGFLLDNLKLKYKNDVDMIDTIKTNHNYLFNFKEMNEQYKFFKDVNNGNLEDEFHREQNFRTTIRGFKVRGVYNTVDEAKHRCEQLKKKDPNHNIYISEVGCWCPWSPNPSDISNQEWSETQLNTLMMNYNKNKEDKDLLFEERSRSAAAGSKIIEEEEPMAAGSSSVFDDEDPWMKNKNMKK